MFLVLTRFLSLPFGMAAKIIKEHQILCKKKRHLLLDASFLIQYSNVILQTAERWLYLAPNSVLTLLAEIVAHYGLLGHVALTEQVHNACVFLIIELAFELVELADARIVELSISVALQEIHAKLVHRIILSLLTLIDISTKVFHESLGCKLGRALKKSPFLRTKTENAYDL